MVSHSLLYTYVRGIGPTESEQERLNTMSRHKAAKLDTNGIVQFESVEHFLQELETNLRHGRIFVSTEESYPSNTPLRISLETPGVTVRVELDAIVVFAEHNHYGLYLEDIDDKLGLFDTLRWGAERSLTRAPSSSLENFIHDDIHFQDDADEHGLEVPVVPIEELIFSQRPQANSAIQDPADTSGLERPFSAPGVSQIWEPSSSASNQSERLGSIETSTESLITDLEEAKFPTHDPIIPPSSLKASRYPTLPSLPPQLALPGRLALPLPPDSLNSIPEEYSFDSEALYDVPTTEIAPTLLDSMPEEQAPIVVTPETDSLPQEPSFEDFQEEEETQFIGSPAAHHTKSSNQPQDEHSTKLKDSQPTPKPIAPPNEEEEEEEEELAPLDIYDIDSPPNLDEVFVPDEIYNTDDQAEADLTGDESLEVSIEELETEEDNQKNQPPATTVPASGMYQLPSIHLLRASSSGLITLESNEILLGLWLAGLKSGYLSFLDGPNSSPGEQVNLTFLVDRELSTKATVITRIGPWLTVSIDDLPVIKAYLVSNFPGVLIYLNSLQKEEP